MHECDVCTNTLLGGPSRHDPGGVYISHQSIFTNFTEFCPDPTNHVQLCYGCQRSSRGNLVTRKFVSLRFPDQRDLDYVLSLKERDSMSVDFSPPLLNTRNFMNHVWFRVRRPKFTDYPNKNVRPGHERDAFMVGLFPLARNGDMFVDSL
ncbi:hypothetical protein FBUS_05920 [Fasciolopsis buskii]|uniref:Uncharacterized protein n=1 Tax=Fasciolopsis buskii TaxID=27845 RepID=A0A8E0SA32_9TREM|nr:hypothetical protein FBUS_05920 [Fasciolopsis buski]